MEVGRDAVMSASGRGDGASDGDALGMAGNTQGADRGQQMVNKRTRSEPPGGTRRKGSARL